MKKKLTSDKKKISLSHSSFDKMSKKEGEESQIKGMISSVPKVRDMLVDVKTYSFS